MTVKQILVPVDFSPCSKNAVKIASELARRWDAHVNLIHAIATPVPHPDIASHVVIEPMLEEYDTEIKSSFSELENSMPELRAVSHSLDSLMGSVTEVVREKVLTDQIDLIVMGTKSEHDFMERLLGSLSSEISSHSRVPVLVIPENIENLDIEKIGVASDFKQIKDWKIMKLVNALADILAADIEVFHIHHPDERIAINKSQDAQTLRDLFGTHLIGIRQVSNEDIRSGLEEYLENNGVDLLVMMPHDRGFLDKLVHGSMTKKMVSQVKIPLIAIHQ